MNRRDAIGKLGLVATGAAATGAMMAGGSILAAADRTVPPFEEGRRCFNVQAFGAKGDGKADDTAAAQKAIDAALEAGGGRVHFPAGQYRLCRGLIININQRMDITGDGLTSELRFEADEAALTWTEDAPCVMSSVRDLCLCATGKDKSPETPAIACLGGTEWTTIFDHITIRSDGAQLGSGIVVERVMDTTTLNNCTIWGVTGVGVKIPRGSEVRIVGGRIVGAIFPYDGLAEGSIGVLMTGGNGGVHILTTDIIAMDTGMQIGLPGGDMNRETFITHATFDSCRRGLWIRNAGYVSVAGCWAASSDEAQIILDSEKGAIVPDGALLVINGGTIGNGGAYGRPGGHHGLVARSGSFTINGAAFWHNKGCGIKIEGDKVSNYAVTGCRFSNNGTAAELGTAEATFMSNMLVDNGTAFTGGDHVLGLKSSNVITKTKS